ASAASRGYECAACRRAYIPGRAPRTTSGAASLMDGPVEPRAQLLALVRGYRISQAIYVVTQLAIPDLLADGPREIDDLARATESHAPTLRRVLLLLAGGGLLDTGRPQRFALTPMSAPAPPAA